MSKQQGFSIIELMVAVALGLFGLLAVSQVLITFNTSRNATAQTMESQNNGTMALYLLERDVMPAGYGLMTILPTCDTINWYYNGALQTPLTTYPVRITTGTVTDGAGIVADNIEVQYGKSADGVPGTFITTGQGVFGDDLVVAGYVGINSGNLIVVDRAGTGICTLYQVHSNTQAAGLNNGVNINTGALSHDTNTYNPPSDPGVGWNLAQVLDIVSNLGTFVGKRYSISASGLDVVTFPTYAAGASPTVVDNIAFMKAEYGRAQIPASGVVDTWSSVAWAPDNTTASQVIAIRIGLVARSAEKIATSTPASLVLLPEIKTAAGATIGAQVDYTPSDTSYRYKTYYTIIPLRNVIWNN